MIIIHKCATTLQAAGEAAAAGAKAIAGAIAENGAANIVLATGASQFALIDALIGHDEIDWSRVTAFHLDEYIGMPETHPASFRRYLQERFVARVPTLGAFHFVRGDAADLDEELRRLGDLLDRHPIDVMFAGIGENGHLAFNDPPADFSAAEAYKVVDLDEGCRRQQFGEGWFATLEDVPLRAISMTIRRIMASRMVILTVPDERKSEAVREVLEGPVTNAWPASILQQHANCLLYLDGPAASRLTR
ncbi:glucosamine-6-phosphate deaminase [Acerihabitans sp.]|uniref:glucosamine-6-phosphate deaminase n=1 Tax=Acerihabitans sp. TaxID=2811394 RepID=UPI002ED97D59